jgi:hypothetical protein
MRVNSMPLDTRSGVLPLLFLCIAMPCLGVKADTQIGQYAHTAAWRVHENGLMEDLLRQRTRRFPGPSSRLIGQVESRQLEISDTIVSQDLSNRIA